MICIKPSTRLENVMQLISHYCSQPSISSYSLSIIQRADSIARKVDACSKWRTCFSLVSFDFSFACVVSIEVVNSKFWTPPVPLKKKRINRFSKGYEIEQKNYWKGLATSCSESRRKYDTRGKVLFSLLRKNT